MKKKVCNLKLTAEEKGDGWNIAIGGSFNGPRLLFGLILAELFEALELTPDDAYRITIKAIEAMNGRAEE